MIDMTMPMPYIQTIMQKIDQKLFLKFYNKSHMSYMTHFYHETWQDLVEYGISFKISLENIKRNSPNDKSFLMIKNNSGERILKIKIFISAESILGNYCENIFIDELNIDDVLLIALNQIPLQELLLYDGNIIRNYDRICVYVLSIDDFPINKKIYNINPTYHTLLNDKWEKKWDMNWNLQYLEQGKQQLTDYIYSKIAGPNIEDMSIYEMHYTNLRKFLKSILYKILTSRLLINILFWVCIWRDKIVENEEGLLIVIK